MKLVIDAIPPSLNKLLRMHWATRGQLKQDWRVLVFDAATRAGWECLPIEMEPREPKLVTFDFYFRTNRRRDADNYQKVLCDSLVEWGLLVDDSPEWCETKVRFWKDKDRPRTEITLEVADLDALRMVGLEVADDRDDSVWDFCERVNGLAAKMACVLAVEGGGG